MIRIVIDKASYDRGMVDGEEGRRMAPQPAMDGFSYCSGYIEGKAKRERGRDEDIKT